jgi:hypothetical protein
MVAKKIKTYKVVSCFKFPIVGVSTPPRSGLNDRSLHAESLLMIRWCKLQATEASLRESFYRQGLQVTELPYVSS